MSKDVFKDLGFDAAESAELHLRCELMDALVRIIKKHGYTQKEPAYSGTLKISCVFFHHHLQLSC